MCMCMYVCVRVVCGILTLLVRGHILIRKEKKLALIYFQVLFENTPLEVMVEFPWSSQREVLELNGGRHCYIQCDTTTRANILHLSMRSEYVSTTKLPRGLTEYISKMCWKSRTCMCTCIYNLASVLHSPNKITND